MPLNSIRIQTPLDTMCKQYIHLTICRHLDCETQVGKKHRNVWCADARRVRRLGRCEGGLVVAGELTHRETISCPGCKSSRTCSAASSLARREGGEREGFVGGGSNVIEEDERDVGSPPPRPLPKMRMAKRARRTRNSVFQDVFERAIEQQVKEFDIRGKRRRNGSNVVEVEAKTDSDFAWLQVESSAPTRRIQRQSSRGEQTQSAVPASLCCYGLDQLSRAA